MKSQSVSGLLVFNVKYAAGVREHSAPLVTAFLALRSASFLLYHVLILKITQLGAE